MRAPRSISGNVITEETLSTKSLHFNPPSSPPPLEVYETEICSRFMNCGSNLFKVKLNYSSWHVSYHSNSCFMANNVMIVISIGDSIFSILFYVLYCVSNSPPYLMVPTKRCSRFLPIVIQNSIYTP